MERGLRFVGYPQMLLKSARGHWRHRYFKMRSWVLPYLEDSATKPYLSPNADGISIELDARLYSWALLWRLELDTQVSTMHAKMGQDILGQTKCSIRWPMSLTAKATQLDRQSYTVKRMVLSSLKFQLKELEQGIQGSNFLNK